MSFILFLGAALVLAVALEPRLQEGEGLAGRIGGSLLLMFVLVLSATWALALVHLLTRTGLWLCTGGFAVAGGLLLRRRRAGGGGAQLALPPLAAAILVALAVSAGYQMVRGSIVPPTEFDALSYHLPKAVEILRARTVPFIPSGDFRIAYFPWNYELLLADGLILTGADQQSYWIGLLAAAGFCAYAAAMLRRAWPDAHGLEVLAGLLLVAGAPVLLLHATAFKNDLLFAFFLLAGLHGLARAAHGAGARAWLLALLGLAFGFGTKSTALFALPVVAWALVRYRRSLPLAGPWRPGRTALVAGGAALLLVLSGSAWPILNLAWCGRPLGETAWVGGVTGFQSNAVPNYLGFSNLWRFPVLCLLRPFSSNPLGVWVPWRHEYFYWPAYNCIYSHFGWLVSVLAAAVPLGLLAHRRDREAAGYRATLTGTTLAFVLLSLPQGYRVDGMFCTFPRYLFCLPVLVALWGLLPLLAWLRRRAPRLGPALGAAGLLAYFLGQSWACYAHDEAKPWYLVEQSLRWPDRRPVMGLANLVDQVAGPNDRIAFDSGYGAFVYALYGAGLSRPLVYLPRGLDPVPIPAGTKWVVIDRKWNVGWSHPGATSTADFFKPIRRGESREDLALAAQLSRDPRFVLVGEDRDANQWVFLDRSYLPKPNSGER